jgi:3-oxoadipate enol-lactonase
VGPPVVLLHGLGLDRRMWHGLRPALAGAGFRVIAVDLPGHGAAGRPARPGTAWLVADLAAGVLAVLEGAAGGPAVLVGFSLGGAVALEVALAHPGRVSALVLVDTAAWMGPEAPPIFLERAAAAEADGVEALVAPAVERWFTPEFVAARPDAVARCVAWLRDNDALGYAAACRALATFDARARLAEVRCPTLVVAADRDQATPVAMAEVLASGIPGAELAVLGPSGHLVTEERPADLERAVLGFLRRAAPPAPDRAGAAPRQAARPR